MRTSHESVVIALCGLSNMVLMRSMLSSCRSTGTNNAGRVRPAQLTPHMVHVRLALHEHTHRFGERQRLLNARRLDANTMGTACQRACAHLRTLTAV
jgi:hypothetical protein